MGQQHMMPCIRGIKLFIAVRGVTILPVMKNNVPAWPLAHGKANTVQLVKVSAFRDI